ncbi:MAG: glucosamine-6-phosphate deaminase [Mycoplasma sp.]|nr:glucosamine-6-phosphate deaminase [Mycoplasma sp.]
MKLIIKKNYDEMSICAAELVKEQINQNSSSILGLATGGTPEGMYAELIRLDLNWEGVKTFNLDEYSNVEETHEMSYRYYMNKHLFNHININKENTHVPSGMGDPEVVGPQYDKDIEAAGGIDLQILGIGTNAHIGFNEPGTSETSETGLAQLTEATIEANSRYFESKDDVPKTAISMGIGSIMKAKKIILIASGANKAEAIKATMEGPVTTDAPSSFLQKHNDVTLIVDEEAAKLLTNK